MYSTALFKLSYKYCIQLVCHLVTIEFFVSYWNFIFLMTEAIYHTNKVLSNLPTSWYTLHQCFPPIWFSGSKWKACGADEITVYIEKREYLRTRVTATTKPEKVKNKIRINCGTSFACWSRYIPRATRLLKVDARLEVPIHLSRHPESERHLMFKPKLNLIRKVLMQFVLEGRIMMKGLYPNPLGVLLK